MKVRLYLCIILVSGMLCNGITYAREMYWQLKDLISQADIMAIVNVDQLRETNIGLLHAQAKLTEPAMFLERRAYKCISTCQDI
jgi:hypothetical protein